MSKEFNYGSFCAGACVAFLVCIGAYVLLEHSSHTTVSSTPTEVVSGSAVDSNTGEEEKSYDTSIARHDIELSSGETMTFYTPSKYFSLTDQYLDTIGDYYDVDTVTSDTMFVVGDNADQTLADTIINMDVVSDLPNVFTQLYGKTYTASEVGESTAYKYMKTGSIPDDAEDDYKINEIDKFTVNGIEFRTFAVSYSNTYQDDDGNDQKVETKEIATYSNTDDAIEIVLYQTTYDEDAAVSLIHEFCGYTE